MKRGCQDLPDGLTEWTDANGNTSVTGSRKIPVKTLFGPYSLPSSASPQCPDSVAAVDGDKMVKGNYDGDDRRHWIEAISSGSSLTGR